MLSWLAPLLVLGLVVFVHELGHFLAAKWAGVYAPRFSLGWGAPLWSVRRGETEYALSWLPIGGYVRMASKEDETAAVLEGGAESPEAERSRHWDDRSMIPHGPLSIPADRWFESKSLVRRLVILLAGVTMNVLLAVAVSVGVVATYGQPLVPPVVDSVVAGKPAAAAGVRAGDRVIAIDGTTVTRWEEVVSVISEAAGRAVTLRVLRGADTVPLVVTPAVESVTGPDGATARVGRIGVAVRQGVEREPVDAATAVRLGWTATWGMAGSVVQVLGRLVTGDVSVNQLGGPLEIARSSVAAAQSGAEALWSLIAFLSINLAVLNLLPIPLLDGGQILLQIAETAYRRPLPLVVKEWYARIGLAAIGTLFLFVTFNDLKRILGGFFD
ncbi:MAG: RIP metalloprotease RseP [Gemmatimonadota bacterium]|nr:RIP metalloprotease RseP [Gemmatimonadota bacterium]MDQ8148666.1 RIP metalloprotease RseP [Gemmatimonadota bacterium]